MGMTARGKKRLALLAGVCVVGAAGLGGAVVVRGQVRARLMQQALAEGREAYAAGDYNRAMRRIGYYVSRADDNPETMDVESLYELADARRREPMPRGQHLVRAAGLARRAAELMPGDPRPLRMLLELYPAMGFGNETLDTAERLLEIEPGDADAMFLRAQMLASVGRRAEAMEAAREALLTHPGSDRLRLLIVQLMLLDGSQADEVMTFVQEQATQRPDDLGAQLLLADWQSRAGAGADAGATLLAARELPITSAGHLEWFVQLLDRVRAGEAGDGQTSVQVADSLLEELLVDPVLGEAAARIQAERLWRRGDEEAAIAAIQTLVSAPAEADSSTLGLACLLAVEVRDEERASELAALIEARDDDQSRHWATLIAGRRALARNELQDAITRLDEAAQLSAEPRLDLVYYWKGRAFTMQGQPTEAVAALRDATRLSPTWHMARAAIINLLVDQGRLAEALQQAETFVGFSPNAQPSLELGQAFSRLFAAAVEAGGVGQITVEQGLANLADNARRAPGSGDLASLHARALAAAGRLNEADAEIGRILDQQLPISPTMLRDLYNAASRHGLANASRLSALAGEAHPDNPDLLFMRAMDAGRAGRLDEGRALFRDAIARAGEADRLPLERAFARFLTTMRDPEGLRLLIQLAERHPDNSVLQVDLLETNDAWTDERVVGDAITRLGAATSDGSAFQLYDARRLLTFLPTDPVARERAVALAYERLAPLLRSEPPVTPALLLGAEAELLEGDADSAIDLLSRAVEYEPHRAGVYPRLIELLQSNGRSVDAERRLRDYAQRDDLSVDARRRRAELLMTQGMWALAIVDAESLDPTSAANLFLLARARVGGGDLEGAGEAYRALLEAPDVDAQKVAAAADFIARREGFDAGLATLDRLPAALTPEQRQLQEAAFYERHAQPGEAAAKFEAIVAQGGSPAAWAELVRFHIRRNATADAVAAADRALAAHPGDAQLAALRQVLDGTARAGLTAEEIAAIAGSVVDEAARQAYGRLVSAETTIRSDRAAGLRDLRALVASSPTFLPARRVLVSALLSEPPSGGRTAAQRQEEFAEAMQLAQAAISTMPAEPRAAQLAYEVYGLLGRTEQALAAAREWRLRSPVDPFLPDLAVADLLMREGRGQEALTTLLTWRNRIVDEATVDRPQGLELLARALAASGRAAEAHELLWPRATEDARWMESYLRTAAAVTSPDDADAWIARLDEAINIPEQRLALANIAFNSASRAPSPERFQRVIRIVEPLADNEGTQLGAMMLAGVSAEQLSDLEAAMSWYRRVVEAGHDEPVALNNLAYLIHSTGGSPDEALGFAQRAVDLATAMGRAPIEVATFRDTLAEILMAIGRVEEAEANYRRAVDLAPGEARFRIGLAESLMGLGRYDAARSEAIRAEGLLQGLADEALQARLRAVMSQIDSQG